MATMDTKTRSAYEERVELLISGYIRRQHKEQRIEIPESLLPIFILYFYQANVWNPDDCDQNWIILSNENLTVTHKYSFDSNYLLRAAHGYSTGTFSWTNKIERFNAYYCNFMGVVTKDAPRECSWHRGEKNAYFYGFRLHAFYCDDIMINGTPKWIKGTPSSLNKGMEFKVTVDIDKGIISCYCNGTLCATLDGLPKNVELFPACYLGGHQSPMIFTTTFDVEPTKLSMGIQ